MAKLYMILYVASVIRGVVGPLPYDLQECKVRESELNIEFQQKATLHPEVKIDKAEWRWVCEEQLIRPEMAPE